MEYNIYPDSFNYERDLKRNEQIAQVKEISEKRKEEIREKCKEENRSFPNNFYWDSVAVGIIAGLVVCFATGQTARCLVYFALILGLSFLIGRYVEKNIALPQRRQNINEMNQKIEKEERIAGLQIKDLCEIAERDKEAYKDEFEKCVNDISVNYVESLLVKEIVDWMTQGICRQIDAADRRKHIQLIEESFNFKVYKDKIMCDIGLYDFEIKRCSNLNNIFEQVALARVIATAIRLNLVMAYPRDISGTSVDIKTMYSYAEECMQTTIIYMAQNGKYEIAKNW